MQSKRSMSSNDTYEFDLPDLGEGLTEAEVIAWLVEPGTAVEEDEPILEVETDKALVEIPSPVAGMVQELHATEGEFVAVGQPLVTFDRSKPKEDIEEAEQDKPAERSGLAIDLPEETPTDGAKTSPSPRGGGMSADEIRTARQEMMEQGSRTAEGDTGARPLATPATRELARKYGIDLEEVPTDRTRDGHPFVTTEQVQAYVDGETDDRKVPDMAERIPYRGIRRTIGEQMEQAKAAAPHVTHHDDADVTDLVRIREQLRPYAESEDVNLTYLPFILKAVVDGLEEHPILNAELDTENEEIILHNTYHVGIAVATDAGLMVPVVTDVNERGLLDIAKTINDLANRARDRTIDRSEMQGSTFTITNFGRIGGEFSTPIINYPDVAILGLGEIKPRPRVVDGEVVPRTTLPLSISIDHRVVDGADAAAFVNTITEYLESPARLLLDG